MLKNLLKITLFVLISSPFFSSCNNDDDDAPTTGVVSGIVNDKASQEVLSGVQVILFNADNNQPTGDTYLTGEDGKYTFTIAGGNYFLKLSSQGYMDVPARGAIPFSVTNGQTTDNPVSMEVSVIANAGWISGTLTGEASKGGCLVVASNGTEGYSAISNGDGHYIINNVPAGTYSVKAWKIEVNSEQKSSSVVVDTETISDIAVSSTSGNTVSGSITFLATSSVEVDVSLTHEITEETIPGLSTTTSNTYSLGGVPDGEYLARASYSNDGIVMDPDWIVKNGEPFVNVSGGGVTRDFSVTNSVPLNKPTNSADLVEPFPTGPTPTFEWTPYSSASDYVIQVTDANGNLIWGGFNDDFTVKNVIVDGTSIVYNSDGSALQASLTVGETYRWKVYASKDDSREPTGWKLISMSEELRGLIIIE
jgi:hypothetical protein